MITTIITFHDDMIIMRFMLIFYILLLREHHSFYFARSNVYVQFILYENPELPLKLSTAAKDMSACALHCLRVHVQFLSYVIFHEY